MERAWAQLFRSGVVISAKAFGILTLSEDSSQVICNGRTSSNLQTSSHPLRFASKVAILKSEQTHPRARSRSLVSRQRDSEIPVGETWARRPTLQPAGSPALQPRHYQNLRSQYRAAFIQIWSNALAGAPGRPATARLLICGIKDRSALGWSIFFHLTRKDLRQRISMVTISRSSVSVVIIAPKT